MSSPLSVDLASRVTRLDSENSDLKKRLNEMTGRWRELTLQLRHSMKMCDSLREEVKMVRARNGGMLHTFRNLLEKLKARQRLLEDAERKYRESWEQHGWEVGDIEKPREVAHRQEQIIEELEVLIEVILVTIFT